MINWLNQVYIIQHIGNLREYVKKDDGTHKPRGGWIDSKSNQIKTNRVLNGILFQGLYHKLLLKLIFNQSPLTQNPFVKVLMQKDIFFKLQQIDQVLGSFNFVLLLQRKF